MDFWAQRTVSPADGREGWTVVDDGYVEHARAAQYLRSVVDSGGSVGTARTYAGRLALWLGWTSAAGVDEAAPSVEQLAAFARWLERTPSRKHRRGRDRRRTAGPNVATLRAARSAATVDGILAAVVEFVRFGASRGWCAPAVAGRLSCRAELSWQALGRQLDRGEHGIAILAPITYRATVDRDEQAGAEETAGVRRLAGFKIEHVWDVSQTSGEPLADVRPLLLEGEAPAGLCDGLVFQIEGEEYTVREGVCRRSSANGETDPMSRVVTIRGGLSPAQRAKTLSHEAAHIRLGHVNDLPSYETCRGRFEVEAESVAYLVCAEVGLDSADYSVAYTAGWAKDPKVIRETAERVITVGRSITDALAPYLIPS